MDPAATIEHYERTARAYAKEIDAVPPAFRAAETVRAEWCIRVDGDVKARSPETVNANLPTGDIEIFAREIEVLSASKELPLGEALEHGWRYILRQNDHPDIEEGVAAFLAKRPPNWRDREPGDLD